MAGQISLAVGLVLFASGVVADQIRDDRPPGTTSSAPDCGTAALFYLLNISGQPIDLPEILSALPPSDPRGYSLREIRACARRLGLRLDGVRLNPTTDRSPDRPVLAFVNRQGHGHYLVVRPVGHTRKLVQVFDGPTEPTVMDASLLYAQPGWTGIALIPSRPNWPDWVVVAIVFAALIVLPVYAAQRRLRKKWIQS